MLQPLLDHRLGIRGRDFKRLVSEWRLTWCCHRDCGEVNRVTEMYKSMTPAACACGKVRMLRGSTASRVGEVMRCDLEC